MPEKMTGVNVEGAIGMPSSVGARGSGTVLIYSTFPSMEIAEEIGGALVESGLAACVNVIPGMRSIYRWQGAIQRDAEVVGIIKTRMALAGRVVGWVRVAHPYTNPALVILPAAGGSAEFLDWIALETEAGAACG